MCFNTACDISKIMKKLLVIGLCSIVILAGLLFASFSYDSAIANQAKEQQTALTSAIAKHDALNRQALQTEQSKGASQQMTIEILCELIATNKVKMSDPKLCQ